MEKWLCVGLFLISALIISGCSPQGSPELSPRHVTIVGGEGVHPMYEYDLAMDPDRCIMDEFHDRLNSGSDNNVLDFHNAYQSQIDGFMLWYKAVELDDFEICKSNKVGFEEEDITCEEFFSNLERFCPDCWDVDGDGDIDYFDFYSNRFNCDYCMTGVELPHFNLMLDIFEMEMIPETQFLDVYLIADTVDPDGTVNPHSEITINQNNIEECVISRKVFYNDGNSEWIQEDCMDNIDNFEVVYETGDYVEVLIMDNQELIDHDYTVSAIEVYIRLNLFQEGNCLIYVSGSDAEDTPSASNPFGVFQVLNLF